MPPAIPARALDTFRRSAFVTLLAILWTVPIHAAPAITVQDDADNSVELDRPAQRIVSLAPHLTENLFAVGAGSQVVGAVSFSDHPEAAKRIPRVGGYSRVDLERILALKPDLIVAWRSGNDPAQITRLRDLGIPVYTSESRTFDAIADTLVQLGRMSGNEHQAATVAASLREGVARLARQYRDAAPVRVFYQVWESPLMTVSDDHLIAQAIALCGGSNIFGDLDTLVPRVDRESVLEADPEVIIAGGMGEDRPDWLEAWRQWPQLHAVREEQLVFIPPSLIQRHTPRALKGARMICTALAKARTQRSAAPTHDVDAARP